MESNQAPVENETGIGQALDDMLIMDPKNDGFFSPFRSKNELRSEKQSEVTKK